MWHDLSFKVDNRSGGASCLLADCLSIRVREHDQRGFRRTVRLMSAFRLVIRSWVCEDEKPLPVFLLVYLGVLRQAEVRMQGSLTGVVAQVWCLARGMLGFLPLIW